MSIPPSYSNSNPASYPQQQHQFIPNFQQQSNPAGIPQQQFQSGAGIHPQQMISQYGIQMNQQPFHQQIGSSSAGNFQVHMQSSQLGSTSGPASHSGTTKPAQLPLEKRITPHGLPPQMLTGYEQMSVEMLCTLGKELVLELMTRMFSIVNTLKMNIKGDNKPNKPTLPGVDNVDTVRFQLEYSRLVFLALTEIRLRIDLKLLEGLSDGRTLNDANPSDVELLKMLADPSPLEEEDGKKAVLVEEFEQNRQQMIQLNCQMKNLEWLTMNSDPAMLNIGGRGGGGRSYGEQSSTSRRS